MPGARACGGILASLPIRSEGNEILSCIGLFTDELHTGNKTRLSLSFSFCLYLSKYAIC